MTIKDLTNKKMWLAPLAGYTDHSFRILAKDFGADILVSEMVSADGLVYNSIKTEVLMTFTEEERPLGIQLFGSDPKIMRDAVHIVAEKKPDFIDINMGCPVKKVTKRGAGSGLMKNPKIAAEIVKEVREAAEQNNLILTVKIRSGWDLNSIDVPDFAKRMEESGAQVLIIHPRTRSEMFTGKSNWQHIGKIKDALQIPVVGNGDIYSPEDAMQMYKETGCDSIMIGRGSIGKPWVFKEIIEAEKGNDWHISPEEKLRTIKKHYNLAIKLKGTKRAIPEMRKQIGGYTKGMRNSSQFRNYINSTLDKEEIFGHLNRLFRENI